MLSMIYARFRKMGLMLSVIMLSVVMLNVVAPYCYLYTTTLLRQVKPLEASTLIYESFLGPIL